MAEHRGSKRGLPRVRAAQMRARLSRRGLSHFIFATIFLIGGLSFGLGPEPAAESSRFWMVLLTAVSTFHLALGLRVFVRARGLPGRLWPFITFVWCILMATVLRYLVSAD